MRAVLLLFFMMLFVCFVADGIKLTPSHYYTTLFFTDHETKRIPANGTKGFLTERFLHGCKIYKCKDDGNEGENPRLESHS
jgi:hypothetical protein